MGRVIRVSEALEILLHCFGKWVGAVRKGVDGKTVGKDGIKVGGVHLRFLVGRRED